MKSKIPHARLIPHMACYVTKSEVGHTRPLKRMIKYREKPFASPSKNSPRKSKKEKKTRKLLQSFLRYTQTQKQRNKFYVTFYFEKS